MAVDMVAKTFVFHKMASANEAVIIKNKWFMVPSSVAKRLQPSPL